VNCDKLCKTNVLTSRQQWPLKMQSKSLLFSSFDFQKSDLMTDDIVEVVAWVEIKACVWHPNSYVKSSETGKFGVCNSGKSIYVERYFHEITSFVLHCCRK